MPPIQAPRGTQDILPDRTPLWQFVETTARRVFDLYGYSEIRTPILEQYDLFIKTTGETTEIVEKQMFTVKAGDETLALRPEGTPPVVRAYVEHDLCKVRQFRKLYYIGPMFRYERPQAGRYRQFHQIGVEALGSSDPLLDVETIQMMARIFDELGLPGYSIRLNTLGCFDCQAKTRQYLREQLQQVAGSLCADCKRRMERNVFRVLDCKNEECRAVIRKIPGGAALCADDAARFKLVVDRLTKVGVPFTIDRYLVRGLDYYNQVVYEPVHGALGAQDALGGGGRYDKLVASQGGPDVGATGFALGLERVVMVLEAARPELVQSLTEQGPAVYAVAIGEEARPRCFELLRELRSAGISAEMDYEGRGVKAQMRSANRLNCRIAVVLGPDEIAAGVATVKDLVKGEEAKVPMGQIAGYLKALLKP